tara:strand:+ start:412 stop:621 length:210 start_codon:yes stop_codon:yes gene_type:complete
VSEGESWRERENARERKREGERVCVCVRERERERERAKSEIAKRALICLHPGKKEKRKKCGIGVLRFTI